MGLSITSNYKYAPCLDGGYSMLHKIRFHIAEAYDKEFYDHYETLLDYRSDWTEWNKRTNKILSNERFKDEDKDLIDFFFMSDCDGKISYKTANKIYNLIKDVEGNKLQLRYSLYAHNDWQDFKELLKGCYSNRANLVWY